MSAPLLVTFVGGTSGRWAVERVDGVRGEALSMVPRLAVLEGRDAVVPGGARWTLRGTTSNERYVTRAEHDALASLQQPLGRPAATRAALIPVRKAERWWALAQDERRAIFEERSRHVATGRRYLPAIARRLHHSRELGEPFDFLTWFEYAPEDAARFEDLVAQLRGTEEWTYVEREIDIRLRRTSARARPRAVAAGGRPRGRFVRSTGDYKEAEPATISKRRGPPVR